MAKSTDRFLLLILELLVWLASFLLLLSPVLLMSPAVGRVAPVVVFCETHRSSARKAAAKINKYNVLVVMVVIRIFWWCWCCLSYRLPLVRAHRTKSNPKSMIVQAIQSPIATAPQLYVCARFNFVSLKRCLPLFPLSCHGYVASFPHKFFSPVCRVYAPNDSLIETRCLIFLPGLRQCSSKDPCVCLVAQW